MSTIVKKIIVVLLATVILTACAIPGFEMEATPMPDEQLPEQSSTTDVLADAIEIHTPTSSLILPEIGSEYSVLMQLVGQTKLNSPMRLKWLSGGDLR